MSFASLISFLSDHLAEFILLLTAFLIAIFRKSIFSYIEGNIKYSFDSKLEELKDKFQQNSNKIDRLQSGALAALSEHNAQMLSRKLKAYEELWVFLCSLDKWAGVASFYHMMNMEEVRSRSKTDVKIREFCETMLAGSEVTDFKIPNEHRLYVDEKIFSMISAYYFYYMGVIADLKSISMGIDTNLLNESKTLDTFKELMPDFKDYLDKYKMAGLHNLMPETKTMILTSIKNNIHSAHDAQGMVDRSLGVLEHYEQFGTLSTISVKIPDELRQDPAPLPDE